MLGREVGLWMVQIPVQEVLKIWNTIQEYLCSASTCDHINSKKREKRNKLNLNSKQEAEETVETEEEGKKARANKEEEEE